MAAQWYSLRTNEILSRLRGTPRLHAFMSTAIKLMPDHGDSPAVTKPKMGIIGDANWNPNGSGANPFWIKVTEDNWDFFTRNKLSPILSAAWDLKFTGQGGKVATFKVPIDPKAGKPQFVNIRMRKSGKVELSKPGTDEQEKGSAFIFRRALNDNAGWNTWQDIVEDSDTFPELVRIFKGDIPQPWLESYFAQQKVLLDEVKPIAISEFDHSGSGSFMEYITNIVLTKQWRNMPSLGGKKDNWNPADIWVVRGDVNRIKRMIEKTVDGPPGTQTIHELNAVLRRLYKTKHIMGLSLKKTGKVAYYEKVNMISKEFIPDTKDYNFDVPMKDFIANFDIESGKDMFTQDVLIKVNAKPQEGKEFSFQIKANSSESTTGSNLKFEPTMKGAGTARLGKAPVDMVVKLLKDMNSNSIFVNDYGLYPKDLAAFRSNSGRHNKTYYETQVLPTLLNGAKKITSDTTTVQDALNAIEFSYDPTKTNTARNTNVRAKLMGLDFFYQVSKLSDDERNEFITDMVFLAQKKVFKKADYFGPFGKIY